MLNRELRDGPAASGDSAPLVFEVSFGGRGRAVACCCWCEEADNGGDDGLTDEDDSLAATGESLRMEGAVLTAPFCAGWS